MVESRYSYLWVVKKPFSERAIPSGSEMYVVADNAIAAVQASGSVDVKSVEQVKEVIISQSLQGYPYSAPKDANAVMQASAPITRQRHRVVNRERADDVRLPVPASPRYENIGDWREVTSVNTAQVEVPVSTSLSYEGLRLNGFSPADADMMVRAAQQAEGPVEAPIEELVGQGAPAPTTPNPLLTDAASRFAEAIDLATAEYVGRGWLMGASGS